MKTRLLFIAVLIFLIIVNSFSQKGNMVLSFIGKDAITNQPVPLENVYVENLTQGGDTTVYGAEPYLYLSWLTSINDNNINTKESFLIEQNFPNPFSTETTFRIYINGTQNININLYDINGSIVSKYSEVITNGIHNFKIKVGLNTIYFLSVNNGKITKSIKLVCNSSNGSTNYRIWHLGKENEFKTTGEVLDFIFQPGDQLLLKASAVGYYENTIFDNPINNKEYLFELQPFVLPTVSTSSIIDITQNSATSGGNVTDEGGAEVTVRGICWSTSPNPTISNFFTTDGSGSGLFTSLLTGLSENTIYYLRAYATNSVGTAYGNELFFTTLQTSQVSGYVYYAGTIIPISDVTVNIEEISYTTGVDGYYELTDVPIGNNTITASKPDYDPYNQIINIPQTGLELIIEMSSEIYTQTVFGSIINQLGNPIQNVNIVIYNPDNTPSQLTSNSNSDGYYEIMAVPTGNRLTRFSKNVCEPFDTTIIIENTNYQLDVELFEFSLPCPNFPTVEYEGQIYNTVLIGNQCWLAENLNAGIMISNTNPSNNGIIEKYCYDNIPENCDFYGGLYKWDEMMEYTTTQGVQGICPPNWHLPTEFEWKQLEGEVDSQYDYLDPIWNQTGFRGFDAGLNLKSVTGWFPSGNGTDLYGFTALPSGRWAGGFELITNTTFYWSSTELNYNEAWYRELYYNDDGIGRDEYSKTRGYPVRCLKD